MAQDANAIADDYVQMWDVRGAKDLADRLFATDYIDHNLQPGQGPGVQESRTSSPSTTRCSRT